MTTSYWRRGLQAILGSVTAAVILAPSPAQAQITRVSNADWSQAFGFKIGYFQLKGLDSRGEDDVLFNNYDSLFFDIEEFNNVSFGGEWLISLGRYLEAGADVTAYQGSVPSIYKDLISESGFEIAQELKLRTVPISGTVRFLPAGRGTVQPFIGAGVSIIPWRYSETGEFVDFNGDVFFDSFVADGTEVAPVILGGVRFAVSDAWLVGFEYRYQDAKGDTGGIDAGFTGDKINLGGHHWNFGIHFKF